MLNRLQCEPPCLFFVWSVYVVDFVLCFSFWLLYTFCKMKCSVWFGSCWRPRTDKIKDTYGFWSRRSRRCLAIVRAILRWKRTTTKRQTWMIYSEENSRRSSRIKPNNLKTWINSKFGTRNFQLPVLVSTFHDKPCPLEPSRLRAS